MNNKEKIRMFLPFSWVICAAISFAYINSHLINTLKLEELKKTVLTVFKKINFSKNKLFIF